MSPDSHEPSKPEGESGPLGLPERSIDYDFDLQDRYKGFSTEVARLGLLGVTAIAYVFWQSSPDKFAQLSSASIWGLRLAAVFFGASVAAALVHHYASIDSMSCHLRLLRLQAQGDSRSATSIIQEKARRQNWLRASLWSVGIAATALTLGAGALGFFALFR